MGGIDISPGAAVAVGVLVGLISTSIQSVGLTLQRKSHILEEEKEEEDGVERRPPYRRRRWQIGMAMFLVSNIVGSTIQITTLPLPVLSTLQASGLVFNTACATLILSEPFTRYSLIGTLLVAGGAVLIAIFGALAEPSHNLDQLLDLLVRTQFLIWVIGTFVVVAAIIVTVWFVERYNHRSARARLWIGMSYGGVSGILSAHTLLLAKSAVELLVRTIVDRVNQFNRWQSWMILVGLVFLAISQLYYLHRGLKLCSTSVLYPFVFCVYNIIAILDGLIYFHQTDRLSVMHACLIALGTVILLAGVVALSWRLSDEPSPHPGRTMSISGADVKSLSHRVPTPNTALGPTLGLLDVDTDMITADTSPYLRPADEEEAVASSNRNNRRPDERTPLLRTATMPHREPQSNKSTQGQRQRRKTVATASDRSDLWDELNDRSDGTATRHFSVGGHHSPRASRSPSTSRHMGYAARGTLPAFTPGTFSWRLPTRIGTMRAQLPVTKSDTHLVQEPPPMDDSEAGTTDAEDNEAEQEPLLNEPTSSKSWNLNQPRVRRRRSEGADPAGSWFRLKWWKKRRRDGEDRGGRGQE